MLTSLHLSTVGELRRRLNELADAGVPDESTIIIRHQDEDPIAAMTYRVEEDFQPADHRDSGMQEPAGYWTVTLVLEHTAPVPVERPAEEHYPPLQLADKKENEHG